MRRLPLDVRELHEAVEVSDRIVQIVPAAAGWRVVEALLGAQGDVDSLPDAELVLASPIACFALLQPDHLSAVPHVAAVKPDDWPSYLYQVEEGDPVIDYLGPGARVGLEHLDEARRMIVAYREKQSSEEGDG